MHRIVLTFVVELINCNFIDTRLIRIFRIPGLNYNSMSVTCVQCQMELNGSPVFCNNCGAQLCCKNCKQELQPGAKFCSECGNKVDQSQEKNRAVNEFEYDQKGNSKKVRARFTDDVGVFFAGAFNMIIGHSPPNRNPFQKQIGIPFPNTISPPASNRKENADTIQDAIVVSDGDLTDVLGRIFKNDGGKLSLKDNRLKEKSNLDKTKRLVVLFCYARKAMEAEPVSREDINEIVTREKLSGSHYRSFMSKEVLKYLSEAEKGSFSILAGGEDFAKQILSQIASPDYSPSKTKSGRKAGRRNSGEPNASSAAKTSKKSGSIPSALETCKALVTESFFDKAQILNDIVQHCKEKMALNYSSQNINVALSRLIRDKILERKKNKESQYEYWKK